MRGTEEAHIELQDEMTLSALLKQACKHLGCKDNYKISKLYNKNGIQLFQEDIIMLAGGDILYLAAKGKSSVNLCLGEDFNFSAILDDYTIVKELGQGGFGKVVLGRHKEEKKEVAIKFMDVSENRKSHAPQPSSSRIGKHDIEHL